MKKNPSTERMRTPSPLRALVCYIWDLAVSIYMIKLNSLIFALIWMIMDITIGRIVLFSTVLLNMMFGNNFSLAPIAILIILIWIYNLHKKRGLCYPIAPRTWCCKSGERPWIWKLLRES